MHNLMRFGAKNFAALQHQAAMAQMLNDAGEGFDLDDLLDIESLDAAVTIVHLEQWRHTE
ncbi:MAG: hypothetical protein E7C35_05720 [Enterobacter hormaechei]|nr:hypothetical protein [Enterobacter hormaechei]